MGFPYIEAARKTIPWRDFFQNDPEVKLSWTVPGGLLWARRCVLKCFGTKLIMADGSQMKIINIARLSVSRLEVLDGKIAGPTWSRR
jgi:hypothetical protein